MRLGTRSAFPFSAEALLWRRRFDSQPGHRWLRELITTLGRSL